MLNKYSIPFAPSACGPWLKRYPLNGFKGKEMEPSQKIGITDLDVRHFIYTTFVGTSRPPTTLETADYFKISIAAVEGAYERLANAHHIALAPGSHGVWMAHPFSGLPTNYVTKVENKRYWGN